MAARSAFNSQQKGKNAVERDTKTSDYIASGFAKIDSDIATLIEAFRKVLENLGETEAAALLPWQGGDADASDATNSPSIEQSHSIAFQLLNMVEEAASTRTRRMREASGDAHKNPGTWAYYLDRLKEQGHSPEEIADFFPGVRVEPVLTAHPTESKRPAVLAQHRHLTGLLELLDNSHASPADRRRFNEDLTVSLERLWRSGEILTAKPEVATERTGILFHLRDVFPKALPVLDTQLRDAWAAAGFPAAEIASHDNWPRIRFGTWVGGDRDGHPFVTPSVTRETLMELRRSALLVIDRELKALASQLPLSMTVQQPPDAFAERLAEIRLALGERGEKLEAQFPDEPWRQYVLAIKALLPLQEQRDENAKIVESPESYRFAADLDKDLDLLNSSLVSIGADRIAENAVWPVRRCLDVFGFHLAALDIRQNSHFHDLAVSQILAAAGLECSDFVNWDEARRVEFLSEELKSPRPFLYYDSDIGPEADSVFGCYSVLRKHIQDYGAEGIGSLIVSMTRSVSDLLVVYILARETGLTKWIDGQLVCDLPVVPLFETQNDLEQSGRLIAEFLAHPVTVASLKHQRTLRRSMPARTSRPIQQVMIGYSDSNKDCGIMACQWALHKAQREVTQAGEDAGVQIRFFHGRGGTISRGAGPTHRFLDALPPKTIQGDFRLTEQGETIAQKYANLYTAAFNLELLLAGVTAVSIEQHLGKPAAHSESDELWQTLADASTKAYTGLVRAEGFIDFYSTATPIDALEVTRIGSRPSRRTGKRTLADLRAIPWVFSWNQSRFYLPGWYGVGSGLEALSIKEPALFQAMRDRLRDSPVLYYVLANVETNLASADVEIMTAYAQLVPDEKGRERFLGEILAEYNRARFMLDEVFQGSLESRRPRMLKTLGLRADALRLLHSRQIELLKAWRAADTQDRVNDLLPRVLLSINAIASGLRTTG